LEGKWQQ
jgi:hypothetical protein